MKNIKEQVRIGLKPVMTIIGITLCVLGIANMLMYPFMMLIDPDISVLGRFGFNWFLASCCTITMIMFTTGLILAAVGFTSGAQKNHKEL